MMMKNKPPAIVEKFISFINRSPTPFHAVHNAIDRLEDAGFIRLKERDHWNNQNIQKGGKYFVTRNQSSISSVFYQFVIHLHYSQYSQSSTLSFLVAFAVGGNYEPGNGLAIVGCHTDSPCFKIRPVSKQTKMGYLQVGVETYGGGIWPTWLDRDLGIAGRVIVKDQTQNGSPSSFTSHLVHISRPILRFPTLAIHLERTQTDQLKCNLETQMVPVLSMATDQLNQSVKEVSMDKSALSTHENHHPLLLSISRIAIQAIERGHNLFSSFAAIEALATSVEGDTNSKAFHESGLIRTIALWDNEEIGSVSHQGAESNFLEAVLTRVSSAFVTTPSPALTEQTLAASFLLSCDMGHAIHPCYPEKHEQNHRPLINKGPAIKTNAKQRYASTAATTFLLRQVADIAKVPLQEYEVRNDMACGSTIGPLVSKIGLRTVDIGCPQLSMHSIREQAGCQDLEYLTTLFENFFEHFELVDSRLSTGE
ncbi:hypothetical protein PSTT_14052 [Puccinia striiformis]|uniref:aspartyl aminopeptidase n=1 Tax=Puccinia striiformis TaxID=27350 RepID=A0A2S4UPA6_9BASI|nr:hypothetical protein PSTT_14052 [Puccinia striiformis]